MGHGEKRTSPFDFVWFCKEGRKASNVGRRFAAERQEEMKDIEMAVRIAEKVSACGGAVYYVGGYVRDKLLNKENKDIDIEVHGIAPRLLEEILDSLGTRLSMGESFGIYGLAGYTLDIAMPRREKVIGRGHRDFETFVDPFIGTKKAAERRDFTINAMMMDVLTGEILDHFGGREDLARGVIRHVSDESFTEDALRVLRAAQFAARFGFSLAAETEALCRTVDVSSLSRERVEQELKKALLKAEKPSVFFETLRKTDTLSFWFPEVQALIGVEQNPTYHAEGDVWNHTMMVLDAAASLKAKTAYPFGFMMTALVHDFGKAICTQVIDGRIRSYGHETKGLPLVKRFLHRLSDETKLIRYVLNLTELHMQPNAMASQGSSVKATNKMFDRAEEPRDLVYIAIADHLGRIAEQGVSHEAYLFARLQIYLDTMAKPYVMGRDLVAAGLKPDARFSDILAYAHKLRLAGVEKEEALVQTLAYARKEKRK